MEHPAAPCSARACVVVPMYNERSVIAGVVAELRRSFDLVVCVDDGSRDDCADVAAAAGAYVVRHAGNLGQGAALETGLKWALEHTDADYFVTFDADGQHRREDAVAMVERAARDDLQVVLGSRFLGEVVDMPAHRRRMLRGAIWFTRATTGARLTDAHNGLRVLRRDAAEQVCFRLCGMAHASELLHLVVRSGWRLAEHPVSIVYTDYSRAKGQRSWNALNIVFELALNRITTAPVRVVPLGALGTDATAGALS